MLIKLVDSKQANEIILDFFIISSRHIFQPRGRVLACCYCYVYICYLIRAVLHKVKTLRWGCQNLSLCFFVAIWHRFIYHIINSVIIVIVKNINEVKLFYLLIIFFESHNLFFLTYFCFFIF